MIEDIEMRTVKSQFGSPARISKATPVRPLWVTEFRVKRDGKWEAWQTVETVSHTDAA